MTILITGGTGSFGSAFAEFLLTATHEQIRIFSRGEHRQDAMARRLASPRVEFVIGDIRDVRRLMSAMDGVDAVVHAAALKGVPSCRRNPTEAIATNVTGTQNVVQAAVACAVRRTVFVSSDKAVYPINTYGHTKALGEAVIRQANERVGGGRFACVRGGNVWGSAGSVVERWREQKQRGELLELTADPQTTRFHLPMPDWTQFVWRVLDEMEGGEIFVPKICAWGLVDLARAFGTPYKLLPARPGDKQHETLISSVESRHVVDRDWAYVLSDAHESGAEPWNYRSDTAVRLSEKELEELICSL